ncbi:MAG TPA: Gfo/Idh/MocA family oxidoreductase [Candidatus Angelobacter sp.]|nr:Gfo/Idh/MocA family oxidoreductase [Candidatus Angelobacter sp.]
MSDVVRWGVIGTGGIASMFVRDLELLPGHRTVAVGSRSAQSADAFGDRHAIAHRHASYADLAADPDVDAVYVATPHPGHRDAALVAIGGGKAVLVEKPFTMDAAEARSLVAAARDRGTFLMEAMWTRFLPHMAAVRDILASGRLGEIVLVTADHGQWFAEDAAFRLFAPHLGGGALLDLGVYPVSFASMVLGAPSSVHAVSDPSFTPVDAQTSMVLRYAGGAHASLTTTLRASTPCLASVSGTEGRLEIMSTFYRPAPFRVVMRDGTVEEHDIPVAGHGMRFEAAEVSRCLTEGLPESPLMPLDETVAVMETLDEVRRQIGLEYPRP